MKTVENNHRTIAARIPWTLPGSVTLGSLKSLVRAFDAGQLSTRQWTHRTRLVVGLWHILCASPASALAAMRCGITACHGNLGFPGDGYHETLTVFFLKMIGEFAVAAPRELDLTGLANSLLTSELTDVRLVEAFYTSERLASAEARDTWMEPDLRPVAWPLVIEREPARHRFMQAEAA